VPVRFQLVIDCADPDRLARFWAAALGYELAPAPAGFATWNDLEWFETEHEACTELLLRLTTDPTTRTR
jgi:hypothetical protein